MRWCSPACPGCGPHAIVVFRLVIPYLQCFAARRLSRGALRTRVPAASFTLSNSPIVRDVLDNGLRILTERMTQVRSISIGVWLTRGSRHETAERGGIAHFVEHMLFKGTATPLGRRHRPGDRLDRRPARRLHRQGIRQLLHQGARRAPAAGDRHPVRHRLQSGLQPRRHRAREEGRRRRDQDGRGHPRRSRPRDLHAGVLGGSSARPADSRHPGNGRVVQRRSAARLFPATPTRRET